MTKISHLLIILISLILAVFFNYFTDLFRSNSSSYFDIFFPYIFISILISFACWYTVISFSIHSKIVAYFIFPLIFIHNYIWYYISTRYGAEMSETIIAILNTTANEAAPFIRNNTICLFVFFSLLPFLLIYTIRHYYTPRNNIIRFYTLTLLLCTSASTFFLYLRHHPVAIKLSAFIPTMRGFNPNLSDMSTEDFILSLLQGESSQNPLLHAYHPFYREIAAAQIIWSNYHPTPLIDARTVNSCSKWDDNRLTVILYIGESFRAANNPMNGYKRNTLPRITQRNNIINLPNLYSNKTTTIPAIYDILVSKDEKNRKPTHTSFIDILSKHHFTPHLIVTNNTGGMWYNTPSIHPLISSCCEKIRRVEAGIELAHTVSEGITSNKRNFFLIEEGTGHQPYISSTKHWGEKNLIDRYDNALLDIDRNLDTLIEKINSENAIIIYTSDHGESFGEDGCWGHGGSASNQQQTHVSAFIWYSDKYREKHPQIIEALVENASIFSNHDMIYHTILSLGGIQSDLQNPKLDMTKIRGTSINQAPKQSESP